MNAAADCRFPDCPNPVATDTGMCDLHRSVTISTSWPNDRHTEGGHG